MAEPRVPMTPALAAHKGLRCQILLELKRAQPLTTQELAECHGVTANAIRRHLKELEAEQLIEHRREQRGHGAPTFSYGLTDAGEALFPKRYDKALTALLAYLEETGGRDEVRRFFDQRFQAQAEELLERLGDTGGEERVAAVVDHLSGEGFMADWSRDSGQVTIVEHNCAMHVVASRYPEICESELRFLRDLLGPGVERQRHIVQGCNSCEYSFNLIDVLGSHDLPGREQT